MRHLPMLIACVLCAGSVAVGSDRTAEVRCAEVGFALSVERGDLAAFRAAIDPDARFVGDDVQRGVDAIAKAWAPFFAEGGPRIRWRPQLVQVLADGELALTRGPYRMAAPGSDGELWGTFNSVWRRGEDGRWRVVFDAGGPPTDEPDDARRALFDEADPAGECPVPAAR